MGARIESVCTTRSGKGLFSKGSVKLAVQAGLGCLKRAGRDPSDLDLIINTGLYRDENIGEPAQSAFIQHGLGANLGYPPDGATPTFNFDLTNGGCGLLTAAQLVDGFITSGVLKCGMIVASDVDPDPKNTEGFDFTLVGAAMLMAPGGEEEEEGFLAFRTETFPEHADLFESRVMFMGEPGKGRNILIIRQEKAYMSRCVDCAQKALDGFMTERGLNVKDLDLIIPSQAPIGFSRKFRARMGIRESRMVDVTEEFGNVHTAGPAAALEAVMEEGTFAEARNVLFVTVGAGITVSMALYRNPPSPGNEDGGPVDELEGIYEDEP